MAVGSSVARAASGMGAIWQVFVVLAGLQWKIVMDSFEEAKKTLPPTQFMEVRYEEFVADPALAFESILEFCQMDYPDEFRAAIRRFEVDNRNHKWKTDLTPRQQAMLQDCLHDHLVRYGYKQLDPYIPAQRIAMPRGRAEALRTDS